MKNTWTWNNKKSEDMGVLTLSLPPIQLSTERITETEIQGRDGSLTELDGYISDTKQIEADLRNCNTTKLINWLRGSGELILGNIPDRYYKARINNVVPLTQVIENQMYNFPIQFKCQPFGYLLDGKEEIILTRPTTLNHNKATYKSLPTITIYGTGACTFTINNRTFNITEIGGNITIESDIEEVANGKGDKMVGLFPYLDIGENNISFTGNITRVELIPNWRAL